MSQPARARIWQRIIDCIIGVIIGIIGVGEAVEFTAHPLHHEIAGLIWAVLLTVAGALTAAGAIMRTVQPGRKQDAGFGCELCGWGGSAFLVLFYAVIGFSHDHNLILLLLLLAFSTTLLGSWIRLLAAMRDVHKGLFQ